MTGDRQSGRTTAALKSAPAGAWYIVPPGSLPYMNALAHALGRADLKITGPGILDRQAMRLRATDVEIVLDHEIDLTFRQWDTLDELRRVRRLRAAAAEAAR